MMLDDIFFKSPQTILLENAFQEFSLIDNTKKLQLAFLKILLNQNVFDLITQPTKTKACLKALISIGYACQSHGLLLSIGAHCFAVATALQEFSGDSLQKMVRDRLIIRNKIAAFAATEIDAGSDIMAMKTYYTNQDDKFTLNGKKHYITNATSADYFLVFATRNSKLYDRGLSLFLVASDTPGITIEPLDTSYILKNSGLGNITFENVVVNHNSLIGKELQGAFIFHKVLNIERSFILIPHIGTMLRWYHQCVSHIKTRIQFKKPLHQFQLVSNKIIEIYEKIKLSYLLAQDLIQHPKISEVSSSIAKNFISEALQVSHQNALSILGATGLFGDKKIPDNLFDSFSSSIYSGTQEIQKNIILNTILDNNHDNIS